MHYEYEFEVNHSVEKLVIMRLLEIREKYKNNKEIFPERYKRLQKIIQNKQEDKKA